jgi:hypothetical protein
MTHTELPGNADSDEAMDVFAARARTLLTESADHLDGDTLSRLHRARSAALDSAEGRRRMPWHYALVPAGLAAALVVGVANYQPPATLPGAYDEAMGQAVVEELDLLQNMEFMAWLALQEEGADGSSS